MDIGIDLGTTFSAIAVHGRIELDPAYGAGAIYLDRCDVSIIPSPSGEPTFPSVVTIGPDPAQDLYGSDALAEIDRFVPITFSKRKIGTDELLGETQHGVSAREVAARFLGHLKRCAEAALNRPVRRAVVTHPAYFDRVAVEETRQAAIDAGFDMSLPDQLLMEPVAAALTYTRTDDRDPLRVLTYDLGGGTLDVTVLERVQSVIHMRAFDGDPLLGGYNFDRELVAWLRRRLAIRGIDLSMGDGTGTARLHELKLLRFAEQIKLELAEQNDDTRPVDVRARNVIRDASGRDVPINERLCRADFEAMIRPLLVLTTDATRRALDKAACRPADIDEVLLVGGSTRGPWVTKELRAVFPDREPLLFEPDLCVAAGAAIHASMVLPRTLVAGDVEIVVDVPEETVQEVVDIAGTVRTTYPVSLPGTPIRLLKDNAVVQDGCLNEDGSFFFPDVELDADECNVFAIAMGECDTANEIRHEIVVRHNRSVANISAVTSVVPQPFAIETFDGFVNLAEEGETLPVRVKRTFRRLNANPTITLKLFQAITPIGEVRIEDIPPEAGLDALVELVVDVKTSGQVKGHARILPPDRRGVLAEVPVAVTYRAQAAMSEAELLGLNLSLREDIARRVEQLRQEDEREDADVLAAQANRLLQVIDRVIAMEPVDCQELQARLLKLQALARPPVDSMQPPWKEFNTSWRECASSLAAKENAARDIISQSDSAQGAGLDESMVAAARDRLGPIQSALERLDKLREEAKDAHRRRDRRRWGQIQDLLRSVTGAFREDSHSRDAPTPITKLLGRRETVSVLMDLFAASARLERAGRIESWEGEIRRIHSVLLESLFDLADIDDELGDAQGRAAVTQVLRRSVGPAEDAVRKLGQDIGTAV